ncbi:hypothetical protein BHM03_00038647 [Ensete ventricosum]|nr:hypothetical protein BHM03_00038647 [Ensete ventricosum]
MTGVLEVAGPPHVPHPEPGVAHPKGRRLAGPVPRLGIATPRTPDQDHQYDVFESPPLLTSPHRRHQSTDWTAMMDASTRGRLPFDPDQDDVSATSSASTPTMCCLDQE